MSTLLINRWTPEGRIFGGFIGDYSYVFYLCHDFLRRWPQAFTVGDKSKQLRTGCLVLLKRICLSRCSPLWRLRTGNHQIQKTYLLSFLDWKKPAKLYFLPSTPASTRAGTLESPVGNSRQATADTRRQIADNHGARGFFASVFPIWCCNAKEPRMRFEYGHIMTNKLDTAWN